MSALALALQGILACAATDEEILFGDNFYVVVNPTNGNEAILSMRGRLSIPAKHQASDDETAGQERFEVRIADVEMGEDGKPNPATLTKGEVAFYVLQSIAKERIRPVYDDLV